MPSRGTGSRLARFEELKGLLRDRDYVTAVELAAELHVSLRTLHRDLALLRDSGLPIDSDRGRGGGLLLDRSWSLGRLHLSLEEAIDLLLSIAIAEKLGSPLLLRHLKSLRRKIVASLGETYQAQIKLLRRRILVGQPASAAVLATYAEPTQGQISKASEAFFTLHCCEISYADRNDTLTTRVIEPQFLYYSSPVWYLLAFDRLRQSIRSFRADRIKQVNTLDLRFRPAAPGPYLAAVEEGTGGI